MRKPILLLLISFLALLKSCEYDFSEDYFNDIEAIQPTATIRLNDFENNIVLNAPTNVNYAYNGANRHRLFEVRIYINDEQIHFSNNEADTFFIDLDNLSDGDYELKVEYYFSSGTGSLADVFNLESYVATEIYTFSVNKSVGVPPVMTLVEIVNGTLFINWDPLSHSNFNEAYLLIEGENNQLLDEILLTEDILNSGEYNDKLSLRNELAYSIKLKNYYTEAISNKVTISIPEINVEVEILNENQHLMRWSEHPLYGNFDHYTYSNYGYSDEILDATGGELIFNTPPVFGEKIYHYLYPRRGNLIVASITKIFDFGNSFDMDLAVEYVYSSQTNSFYALEKIGPDYYGSVQQIYLHQLDPTDISVIN